MYPDIPYPTSDAISVQLDMTGAMADVIPYLEFCAVQSRRVREAIDHLADVRVGSRDEERLDAFPARQPRSPIVVFVHGGWWMSNTRKHRSYLAHPLLAHGFAAIISDYALCPKVRIPDISAATRAAVAWAFEHAAEINGDPDRIFVVGHSAGGQQAGMMAVTDWRACGLPSDVVKGAVPMSGIFDMRVIRRSYLQPYVQLTGETELSESPLFHIPETAPPVRAMVGGEESVEFHRQARLFVAAYSAKGHRADYVPVAGEDHATYLASMGDPDSQTCQLVVDFLRSC